MVNFLGCFASGCSTESPDGRPGPAEIEAVSLPGLFDPHRSADRGGFNFRQVAMR
jgi:hypothetical protein